MKRKRRIRKTRRNETRSVCALADPKVASLVKELRWSWKALDRIERGDRLHELVELGCSRRGLEKALKQSATTIRRHIELAELPPKVRDAVREGFSAKKVLAKRAQLKRTQRQQSRITKERESGALSDEVADIVLQFCRAEQGVPDVPMLASDLPTFLSIVATRLLRMDAEGVPRVRIAKRRGTAALFKETLPESSDDDFWMEVRAEWLARAIRARCREQEIWERGLQKAQNRAKELKARRTPSEIYQANAARRALITHGVGKRNY